MHKILFALTLLLSTTALAQPLFTLSPDTVFAIKPASTFTMYNYAQFDNLSGDTLQMRWVKLQTIVSQSGGHGGQGLGDWTISVQDPANFYNPANDLDSADFILPPLITPTDKFIMQLYPNGQEGFLTVIFKIFAVNDPANFVTLTFDYTVTPATTAAGEVAEEFGLEIFPNPAREQVQVRNKSGLETAVRLFSTEGRLLDSMLLGGGETRMVEVADLPQGVYFLKGENDKGTIVIRLSRF